MQQTSTKGVKKQDTTGWERWFTENCARDLLYSGSYHVIFGIAKV